MGEEKRRERRLGNSLPRSREEKGFFIIPFPTLFIRLIL